MDRIAARGDGLRYRLPIGQPGDGSRDFSFSGLKTAMLRELEKPGVDGSPLDAENVGRDLTDLFASFQRAIVAALLDRVERVHREEGIRRLALSGGVAANSELRATLARWGEDNGVPVLLAQPDADDGQRGDDRVGRTARIPPRRRAGAPAEAPARSRWPLGT